MILFKDISLKLWADTLIQDFGQDDLPILDHEDNWRAWGNRVAGEPSFIRNNAPRTEGFETAEEWAQSVCGVMANHP